MTANLAEADAPLAVATPARASRARWLVVLLPYAWLLVLFLIPFLIVIKISLSTTAIAMPPYAPAFGLGDGIAGIIDGVRQFAFDNYVYLTEDSLYWRSYVSSIEIAAISTFLVLLVG